MNTKSVYRIGRRNLGKAACHVFATVVLAAGAGVTAAEQPVTAVEPVEVRHVGLETAFWVCDYVGTTQGVSATPMAECSAATDALKNEKFGGDFSRLLEWWRANKHERHLELARAVR